MHTLKTPSVWLTVILFTFIITTKSQNPFFGLPQIEYFKRSDYHGGTQNWCISQAKNGLTYVANNYGILEYDGSRWRLLPPFSQSITRAVLADEDRIYATSSDEFGYYKKTGGADFNYISLSKQFKIAESGDFWAIYRFNDLIVFQSEKELCIYKPKEESIEVVPARSRIPNSFLVNGMLLIHDEMEGLMELRQNRLFKIQGGEKFVGIRIGAILSLPNDELVIGTMTNGLYLYGPKGVSKWNVPANDLLTRSNVFCGAQSGDDLVFGTIQSGVVVIDAMGQVKSIVDKDRGLWNNTVLGLYIDRDNRIWAGLDNGLAKLAYNSSVSYLHGYFDLGTGYCMARQAGKAYLGTNQGLYVIGEEQFYKPDKTRNSFKHVKNANGQVWSLYTDNDGTLLCGHNHGVYNLTNDNAILITPPNIVGAWCFKRVPNRKDLLMIGTYSGLSLLEKTNGSWQFKRKLIGFDESSRFMEWDTDGGLWVAHGAKGLFKLQFDHAFESITNISQTSSFKGLYNDKNITLTTLQNKVIFLTEQGIMTFDAETKTFEPHILNNYFNDNKSASPTALSPDKYGNIWFFSATGTGVLRIQEDGSYRKITNPFSGLTNKMVNGFESVYSWDEKNAVFGIEDGFAHYSVAEKMNFMSPFSAHIRGFKGTTFPDSVYYTSQSNLTQPLKPTYTYANNAFEVSYSATWYGNGNVEFSTYLEGFDINWGEWDLVQDRQFTRLPEGTYTFWVKARNIYNVETDPIGFQFIILPPWYRSVWAKTAYLGLVLGILALIGLITRHIVEKSRKRAMLKHEEAFRLKEEQMIREALVSEKEMIRLRNEKLHNEMLHKEKELANSAMHVIQKNDFLIKIKEHLIKVLSSRDPEIVGKRINQVVRLIDNDIDNESHWEVFETHLGQVHEDFLIRLQQTHTDLLPRELKLCAYLRMGMSSKEIASLMNISSRAVENNRYKLRKKLGIDQGDNLLEYINRV
jgi:DNA-binding CsgD family transcriptional regulator